MKQNQLIWKLIMTILFSGTIIIWATAPKSDELLMLHNVTQGEMNSITSPIEGSLVFNSSDEETYERNNTDWDRITSDGSETKITAGACTKVTGRGTSTDPYVIKNNPPSKTQTTAGSTCKQILDIGCPVTSGIYWINPDGGSTSNAFEVYCDMTTDGGGWTQIAYESDLAHINRWTSGDARRWLPSNLSLVLSNTQINNIRAVSTEGKQTYRGTCDGVITYLYGTTNYTYSFGFRFHNGDETAYGQSTYPDTNIAFLQDGCYTNSSKSADTAFLIRDIRVPIINVYSRDSGNSSEKFGSPLTKNPAWLR